MQFHILDENYTPVAVMDNELPDAIHFNKSKFHRFLTGSADFLDFETSKLHVDHKLLQVGYWIAFKYSGRDHLLYITEIAEAERDKMMAISSMSLNLDLNLENMMPFSADTGHSFAWYFDRIMFDTGYEIGVNEISNLSRKLSWDSEMSRRAFLQSVATQFDNAELDYEVVLNSDFTIKKRLVHIKKKIGEVRDDIELRYGDNVKTVKRTTSIDQLYTAIVPVSKDDNDKVTTIASVADWQELDKNGNVQFFHKKGENTIKAPQANARFGNRGTNVNGGGYIVYDFSFDKVSQSELFNRAKSKIAELSVPTINYEVEGRTGARIGDTVKIVDDGYTPQLILLARVLEQIVSFDDATVEQATFGNYKALQSQISADLMAKMQQLAEENAPYKAVTLTTNGLTFKNSEGSTTLTARLYKGSKEIVPESYAWTIDGVVLEIDTNQCEVTADDINSKAVVRWSATINDYVVAFDEVTIIDVSDGIDGSDGESPIITINPDTSLTIVDAEGEKTTPELKGEAGSDGSSGILLSETPPEAPEVGQLWQDISAEPQLVKKWDGSDWTIWEMYVENLNANNLSAISPNLGNIKGGSYASWYVDTMTPSGRTYLNGIYLFNGHVRSLCIYGVTSIDPDVPLNNYLKAIGSEQYAGTTKYFAATLNPGLTPNEILTNMDTYGYWSSYDIEGDTGKSALVGEITGYATDLDEGLIIKSDEVMMIADHFNLNEGRVASFKTLYTGKYTAANNTEALTMKLGDLTNVKYLHFDLLCYNKTQRVTMDISNTYSNFNAKWKYASQILIPELTVTTPGKVRIWEVELLSTGAVQNSEFRFGEMRYMQFGVDDWRVVDDTNRSNTFVHKITAEY